MRFERGKDPKEVLEIGIIPACKKLLKEKFTDAVILLEDEIMDVLNTKNDDIWKFYPHPHTAADFTKSEGGLNKFAGNSIAIGIMNDRFVVMRNVYQARQEAGKGEKPYKGPWWIDRNGTVEDLYNILLNEL